MVVMTDNALKPGTYTKGDRTIHAETTAEAVQATFDGFVRQADEAPAADEAPETTEVVNPDAPETSDDDTNVAQTDTVSPARNSR